MSASFTLTLDTRPPANPQVVIEGGASLTGTRDVLVALATADYESGSADVDQMKLWGDVDPSADLLVQPQEGDSAWRPYAESLFVRLSAGTGRKTLQARLRDTVCNETVVFSDFIDFDPTVPVVLITSGVDRSRISKIAPCHEAVFSWQANMLFTQYQVRAVASTGAPYGSGVAIGTVGGSTNVAGSGSFPALTPIVTKIRGVDLETASPGDTLKHLKVFVLAGMWSS